MKKTLVLALAAALLATFLISDLQWLRGFFTVVFLSSLVIMCLPLIGDRTLLVSLIGYFWCLLESTTIVAPYRALFLVSAVGGWIMVVTMPNSKELRRRKAEQQMARLQQPRAPGPR